MPVTAKLSRAFYDKLGDDVATELVNWFNEVDLTYRTELRELNELNFARFDAKVGERLAELRAELRMEFRAELDKLENRLENRLEARFDDVTSRFDGVTSRFTTIEKAVHDARLSGIRWTFGFWLTTLGAIVALYLKG